MSRKLTPKAARKTARNLSKGATTGLQDYGATAARQKAESNDQATGARAPKLEARRVLYRTKIARGAPFETSKVVRTLLSDMAK